MTAHRAAIEAGPHVIRRLCCAAGEVSQIPVEAIDDTVTLVDERPVTVEMLWREALRMLAAGHDDGAVVVHPSWWSALRVGVIAAAAATLSGAVAVQPRSWLHAMATGHHAVVSVEIADRLVAVLGPRNLAVARRATPHEVVGEVVEAIEAVGAMTPVVIDVADTGDELASLIVEAVQGVVSRVLVIDGARFAKLALAAVATPAVPPPVVPRRGAWTAARMVVAGAAATGLGLGFSAPSVQRPGRVALAQPSRTTVLVEGRVALAIPADWATQRVVSGPGSARVQVSSPADPEVALHVTQSTAPGETLSGAAERLRRAIDAEPAGVFVDFDPAGTTAGRPAVTYREVRPAHDVRWTVLVDGSVRISVGCQSPTRDPDAVREACEQAVRSAHAVE